MHVLFVEKILTGHHPNYLKNISASLLDRGHHLTISIDREYVTNAVILELHKSYPALVSIKINPKLHPVLELIRNIKFFGPQLYNWLIFKAIFKEVDNKKKIEYVFIPYLDYCLDIVGLLGSPFFGVKWSAICMRPTFHLNDFGVIAPKMKINLIKKFLFNRLLRNQKIQTLFSIDELLVQYIRENKINLAHKIEFIPDPVELSCTFNKITARKHLGLSNDYHIILVYGYIDERKGIDQLLDAISKYCLSKEIRILVMGKQTSKLADILKKEPRIISINKRVDSETEEAGFRSADAVWLGYRDHYAMSGVLLLSACARKPIIATQVGLIGWMSRRYDLGFVIDCEDLDSIAYAVNGLYNNSTNFSSENMAALQVKHTWFNLNRKIINNLIID